MLGKVSRLSGNRSVLSDFPDVNLSIQPALFLTNAGQYISYCHNSYSKRLQIRHADNPVFFLYIKRRHIQTTFQPGKNSFCPIFLTITFHNTSEAIVFQIINVIVYFSGNACLRSQFFHNTYYFRSIVLIFFKCFDNSFAEFFKCRKIFQMRSIPSGIFPFK